MFIWWQEEREVLKDVSRVPEAKVVKDLIRHDLDEPISNWFFLAGSNLKEQERTELIQFLKKNVEVFA